jgi:Fe-S oxidoreductase
MAIELPKLQREDMFACAQCGYCIKPCPTYDQGRWESISARGKIFFLKELLRKDKSPSKEVLNQFAKRLYDCSICGRCKQVCHLDLDLVDLWFKLREYVVEKGLAPSIVLQVVDSIFNTKNVFAMDSESRNDWTVYTGAEVKTKDKADLVYFVGCVTSYSGRLQEIPTSVTAILNHVGEDWTLLKDEWCCGHPLKVAGDKKRLKETVEHNVKIIEETGATRVVSGCPGCCLALKQEYLEVVGRKPNFEVIHFSELLDQYIEEGKLKIPHVKKKVTYHDPCELGRMLGIYTPPRRVINSINGGVIEPEENREDGVCCGSGGLLKAVNMPLSQNVADKRLKDLAKTEAQMIVSACPSCDLNLMEASLRINTDLPVVDIAVLVAKQLGLV